MSLDKLLCETAELRQCSQQHKVFIAPIRRIPPELLAEVFMHSVDLEARAAHTHPNPITPPLILGEICREWRAIALSTPRLW
ncbi:hypothetical protein DFH07DRAFT_892367, partial [Mycena maculata]